MRRERVGERKIKEEGGRKKENKRENEEGRIRMIDKESKRDGERVK